MAKEIRVGSCRASRLRSFLTGVPYRGEGRRLLDIGCGSGEALAWARDNGWDVFGLDPDPQAVELARRRGLHQVNAGDLLDQEYPDDFFDAITFYQSLEHLHSPSACLSECRRILAPDGAVYISVPNFQSFPRRLLGERWYGLQLPIHLFHFSPATLSELASSCGFRIASPRSYSTIVSAVTTLKSLRAGGGDLPPLNWRGAVKSALRGNGGLSDIIHVELRPVAI